MNNVYYRFTHLVGGDYSSMPAKLRMNVIGAVVRVLFVQAGAVALLASCGGGGSSSAGQPTRAGTVLQANRRVRSAASRPGIPNPSVVDDKITALLAGKPVFVHSLQSFLSTGLIGRVVITYRDEAEAIGAFVSEPA